MDDQNPPSRNGGSNATIVYQGAKRSNTAHRSTTDPDARLFRKNKNAAGADTRRASRRIAAKAVAQPAPGKYRGFGLKKCEMTSANGNLAALLKAEEQRAAALLARQ